MVRRDVVRLVTPGTLDRGHAARRAAQQLSAVAVTRARASAADEASRFALAWLDISTGEFRIAECDRAGLAAEIARLEPGEIVVSDALYSDPELAPYLRTLPAVTPLTRDVFDGATAERRLRDYFAVATTEAFGALTRLELTAAAACVTYVERTQLGKRPPLSPPSREAAGTTLAIDQATRANLEIVRTLSGERRGSLLAAIDRTMTAAGSRLLAQRLAAPLTEPEAIDRRLDAVEGFVGDTIARQQTRDHLNIAPDLARSLSRLVVGRGGPRDLAAIRDGISVAAGLAARLDALASKPAEIADAIAALRAPDPALPRELAAALADELPLFKRDGGFVREGYEAALDESRALRDESRKVVAQLQARYADESRRARAQDQAQQRARLFRRGHGAARRQAVRGAAERDLHPPPDARRPGALHHHRTRRTGGQDRERRRPRARARAGDFRAAFCIGRRRERRPSRPPPRRWRCSTWPPRSPRLRSSAPTRGRRSTARSTSSSRAAATPWSNRRCPIRSSPTTAICRRRRTRAPAASGCITGPNMAGKSTFLRQNALIVLLAQMGSFVPARRAKLGTVDRLFSRVGAADDLARGRSTFMVEMVETAAILNQAGERALVILDEIGRGTATFDGLSIAWAAIEHLHESNRCRALFATHFHELTALAATLKRLHNVTVRVKEWQGDVVFLHEVVAGAADRSYGIQVAKLAGLPASVIERAKVVLAMLEADERAKPRGFEDLPLFAAPRPAAPDTRLSALDTLIEALAAIHPDELTPREALEALYALKQKAQRER